MSHALIPRALLRRLEWCVPVMWHGIAMGSCPECCAVNDPIYPEGRQNPHAPECSLAAALREPDHECKCVFCDAMKQLKEAEDQ